MKFNGFKSAVLLCSIASLPLTGCLTSRVKRSDASLNETHLNILNIDRLLGLAKNPSFYLSGCVPEEVVGELSLAPQKPELMFKLSTKLNFGSNCILDVYDHGIDAKDFIWQVKPGLIYRDEYLLIAKDSDRKLTGTFQKVRKVFSRLNDDSKKDESVKGYLDAKILLPGRFVGQASLTFGLECDPVSPPTVNLDLSKSLLRPENENLEYQTTLFYPRLSEVQTIFCQRAYVLVNEFLIDSTTIEPGYSWDPKVHERQALQNPILFKDLLIPESSVIVDPEIKRP